MEVKDSELEPTDIIQSDNNTTEIKNPDGLLSAFEKTKTERDGLKKRIKVLEAKLTPISDIDPIEYQELRTFYQEQQIKLERQNEETLKEEKNWELLAQTRADKIQKEYEGRIKTLSQQFEEVKSNYAALELEKTNKDNQLQENELKTLAFQEFAAMQGRGEDFGYIYDFDLKGKVERSPSGELIMINDSGEMLTDGNGNFLTYKSWLSNFSQRKPNFFNPKSTANGVGTTPQSNNVRAQPSVRTISKSDLGNPIRLRRIAHELGYGDDATKAIIEGAIKVAE